MRPVTEAGRACRVMTESDEAITTNNAAAAITAVMVSMPERTMRPAAKAAAITAMAMSTTASSRSRRPVVALDLEAMALHFGSGRSLKQVPAPAHKWQA